MNVVLFSFNHTKGGHLNVIVKGIFSCVFIVLFVFFVVLIFLVFVAVTALRMSALTSAQDMLVVLSSMIAIIDVPRGNLVI